MKACCRLKLMLVLSLLVLAEADTQLRLQRSLGEQIRCGKPVTYAGIASLVSEPGMSSQSYTVEFGKPLPVGYPLSVQYGNVSLMQASSSFSLIRDHQDCWATSSQPPRLQAHRWISFQFSKKVQFCENWRKTTWCTPLKTFHSSQHIPLYTSLLPHPWEWSWQAAK